MGLWFTAKLCQSIDGRPDRQRVIATHRDWDTQPQTMAGGRGTGCCTKRLFISINHYTIYSIERKLMIIQHNNKLSYLLEDTGYRK